MKVLFIDWYKTLSNSLFWEHLKLKDPDKFETISKTCFSRNESLIKPWMRGEYTSEDIAKIISKETKIGKSYILRELEKSASEMKFVSNKIPGLIKKIKNKGIKVIIATDNMDTLTRWTVPSLKLNEIFDEVLCSWDIKALKSDFEDGKSLFFDSFFANHPSIKPKNCTLVDDTENKECKISLLGIKYSQITNPKDLFNNLRSVF